MILADPHASNHLGCIRAFGFACDGFDFVKFQDAHVQRLDTYAFALQSQRLPGFKEDFVPFGRVLPVWEGLDLECQVS